MSVKSQIIRFYEQNPDEELTADDMAVKWDVSKRTIERTISELRNEGFLQATNRDEYGSDVWPWLHYSRAPA